MNLRDQRGFTLMELIITLAIVITLTAISFPLWNAMLGKSRYRETANYLAMAMREARGNAAAENREYRVAVDYDSTSFWLEQNTGTSASAVWTKVKEYSDSGSGTLALATGSSTACSAVSGDGDTTNPDITFKFKPNGSCGGIVNATYLCVLDENGDRLYRAGVPTPATGRIVTQRYLAESDVWQ